MNDSISAFLQEGHVHSTEKSHCTAAKAYHTFLLNRMLSRDPIQITNAQHEAFKKWKPTEKPSKK